MARQDSARLPEAVEKERPHQSTRFDERCQKLQKELTSESFDKWYREREFARNIRNGTPYFNRPSDTTPPTRHSPSRLLQCQRKTFYDELNAPEEITSPKGIFWFGTRFEEDIVVPFLEEAVAGTDEYVTNSIWVDFTIQTSAGELRIKGETDPVIVDREASPILLTEIKTKQKLDNVDSPNRHHRAQAHAYMKGLTEKYDRDIVECVILYGSRTTLDIEAFRVGFDPYFWRNSVVGWAEEQTLLRLGEKLPPAEPEYDWECEFCPYQERCGQGEKEYQDTEPAGILPLYGDYPKGKLIDYLEVHEDAKLTPTLAYEYPDLAEDYGVSNWHCLKCSRSYEWDNISWHSNVTKPPDCPACEDSGTTSWLRGPTPEAQHDIVGSDDDK